MINEIWKDIPEWEGLYQVSNLGRVKNVKRNKVKVLDTNNAGYLRVQLCDNDRRKRYFIHRLVAHVFVSGYFDGAQVNHIDMDRTNNCADNLEWVTPSENQKKAFSIKGLHSGHFHDIPYKITFSNGATIYFDNMKEVVRSVGLSKSLLYYRLNGKPSAYIKEIDGILSKCNA